MEVDWRSIRPLNGDRAEGFEELCSQLARYEAPAGSRFERKGSPDAGVECYATLEDGAEWAWQAKYFDKLEDSQWSQIDGSVRTALAKHPKITRYMVCCPLDMPDARIGGRLSARERWDRHVARWAAAATEAGMTVDFAYWGGHELLERLSRGEHSGRARFWFGSPEMDPDWFGQRLDEAVASAGPRYTPELHIGLSIAEEFEAFGRTEWFFHKTIRTVRDVWSDWESACSVRSLRSKQEDERELQAEFEKIEGDADIVRAKRAAAEIVERAVSAASSMEVQPAGALPFGALAETVAKAEEASEAVSQVISASGYGERAVSHASYQFRRFAETLRKARTALVRAGNAAGSPVMIVRGDAGTGKTHLLCDVARRRLDAGRPTILFMGQRFTGTEDPWAQALAQVDMDSWSGDDCVGALESAAQAAGMRALVMIDALNEGRGSKLWPVHLPAFVARVRRSRWIGLVLAVRSSYEVMIPEQVRANAFSVRHVGFVQQSHRAIGRFFNYYGLSLAAAPWLGRGFDNPLFLKTVCAGLQGKGMTELPRGSQGISAIFELYLSSVNDRLARSLGYSPRNALVQDALRDLAGGFADASQRWLDVAVAAGLVDAHLPGRTYRESLYRALVTEGVLVEELGGGVAAGGEGGEVVFVAYDRLADHLLVDKLLEEHFDEDQPDAAFVGEGGLGFVLREEAYEVAGSLEALCVRLPELTGREVADMVPRLAGADGFEGAFRASLTWRDETTVSDRTRDLVLERLGRGVDDVRGMVAALLTVATVPRHPLNADFVDARLREDAMPVRDAWWSASLAGASSESGPARRLLDWALALKPEVSVDDETVMLGATFLAWLLTTPSETVRTAVVRALVNLLWGRTAAAIRLIQRFADVDDVCVVERLYAVAYGVATRNHDPVEAAKLAACVYSLVFADAAPPPNLMLRDYARGVVERALYLGSSVAVDEALLRPPYESPTPTFPSEQDIGHLLAGEDHHPHAMQEKKDADWARRQIGYSVMQGRMRDVIRQRRTKGEWLLVNLSDKTVATKDSETSPESFDRGKIERYVLRRVFELGWTTELFGEFDSRWNVGGSLGDTESFGSKYQRIAHAEVLGVVADHFEYREPGGKERAPCCRFDGPWQLGLRTYDPTWPTEGARGGDMSGSEGHPAAWWTRDRYEDWEEDDERLTEWVAGTEDLPDVARLLSVAHPADGTSWLNCGSGIVWRQRPRIGRSLFENLRGQLSYWLTAYLVRQADVEEVLHRGREVSFRRLVSFADPFAQQVFMGEHAWSPAAKHAGTEWREQRMQLSEDRTVWTRLAFVEYTLGGHGHPRFEDRLVKFPCAEIVERGRLRWSASGADFVDEDGDCVAYDPCVQAMGPSALLVRADWMAEFLAVEELALVWLVSGVKDTRMTDPAPGTRQLEISGAYMWTASGPEGFVDYELSEPVSEETGRPWLKK